LIKTEVYGLVYIQKLRSAISSDALKLLYS